jgi:hypothetical protein
MKSSYHTHLTDSHVLFLLFVHSWKLGGKTKLMNIFSFPVFFSIQKRSLHYGIIYIRGGMSLYHGGKPTVLIHDSCQRWSYWLILFPFWVSSCTNLFGESGQNWLLMQPFCSPSPNHSVRMYHKYESSPVTLWLLHERLISSKRTAPDRFHFNYFIPRPSPRFYLVTAWSSTLVPI